MICPTIEEYRQGKERARKEGQRTLIFWNMKWGGRKYLENYRTQTGWLPSAATWRTAVRGAPDGAGDFVGAIFRCSQCGMERRAPQEKAQEVERLQREGRQNCQLIPGLKCRPLSAEEWATPRGEGTSHSQQGSRSEIKVKKEDELRSDTNSFVEITGYSPGALQFFNATTKYLKATEYAGGTSELEFRAWQQRVERYFITYGIQNETEKVAIAAALLSGEAMS